MVELYFTGRSIERRLYNSQLGLWPYQLTPFCELLTFRRGAEVLSLERDCMDRQR